MLFVLRALVKATNILVSSLLLCPFIPSFSSHHRTFYPFLASTGTKLLTLFEFLQKQKLELGDNKPNMKHSLKYLLFTEVLSFFPFLFLRIQLQLRANSSDTKQFLLRARRIRRRAKLFLALRI